VRPPHPRHPGGVMVALPGEREKKDFEAANMGVGRGGEGRMGWGGVGRETQKKLGTAPSSGNPIYLARTMGKNMYCKPHPCTNMVSGSTQSPQHRATTLQRSWQAARLRRRRRRRR
jgi:hypothetical protein